ncbi:MAG: hypothetical protein CVU36_23755 [Betaproteobacteria bacterium HGW-Betaproteobacteria-9]|nr:MAG: hypothetical protein CVU36_23755 [Betaproteobacteria bacterium HGW-Betaproteobacteria-9]
MSSPDQHVSSLAKQARELFVVHVGRALPDLVKTCETRLASMLDQAGPARDMQERRDAWMAFQKSQTAWLNQSRKVLQRTLLPRFTASGGSVNSAPGRLELMAEGAMDDQILASRLAMRVLDQASTELNELRLRIQHLEKRQELPRGDVLLPDVVARILVDQWLDVLMTREGWLLVQDALAPMLAKRMHEAYKAANEFLVSSGVMKEIDLQALVKRAPGSRSAAPAAVAEGRGGVEGKRGAAQVGDERGGFARQNGSDSGGQAGMGSQPGGMTSSGMGVHDETRMMTSASPLCRRCSVSPLWSASTPACRRRVALARAWCMRTPHTSSARPRPCASAPLNSSRPPRRPQRRPPSRWWR